MNMQTGNIGVLDSGVGGVSLLLKLNDALSNKKIIYLGDRQNAPYGNKPIRQLLTIAVECVQELLAFDVDKIILACNTISCNLLGALKEIFTNVKFYGVFPPVERLSIFGEDPLLLCTNSTARKYKGFADIIAFENLAMDIECNADFEKVNLYNHLSNSRFYCKNNNLDNLTTSHTLLTTDFKRNIFDHHYFNNRCLILGCTHYFFVKNQIFNHFRPRKIYDGSDFCIKKFLLENQCEKSLENKKENDILFIGKNSGYYNAIYNMFRKVTKKN